MAPKRSLQAAQAAKGKGKMSAAPPPKADESSGSEDLVSHSSEGDEDSGSDGEESEDEDAPQQPAPDDGEGSDFEELQAEFEFCDLRPIDFHGLRALLQRLLDGELPFALSELVEALIAQANTVGAVIKANGDVDPLGVLTVLPVERHRQAPAVQQILGFLRRHCPADVAAQMLAACASPKLGLILSERLLNIPPELAPPLIAGLFEEIGDVGGPWWWESEKAPSEALRQSYVFDRFLILTRVYRDDAPDEAGGAGPSAAAGPAAAKKARTAGGSGAGGGAASPSPPLIYPKPEDEALHRHATFSFLFPAAVPEATAVADRGSKLTQMRLVMCVPADAAAAVQRDTERIVAALAAAPAPPR